MENGTLQSGRCLNFRDVGITSESDFLGHSLRSWSPLFGTFRIVGPFGVKEAWDVSNIFGTLRGLRSLGHLIWDTSESFWTFRDKEVCGNFLGLSKLSGTSV